MKHYIGSRVPTEIHTSETSLSIHSCILQLEANVLNVEYGFIFISLIEFYVPFKIISAYMRRANQ